MTCAFLWVIEFLTTFTFKFIQIWQYCEKSCETSLLESLDKSFKTRQDLFSYNIPVGNSGFFKIWKNYDFWRLFLKNIKMSKSWIICDCKYDQSCFNSEKFPYSKSSLLKLPAVESAVLFQRFLQGSSE